MCHLRSALLFFSVFCLPAVFAADKPAFNASQWAVLQSGKPILIAQNPCLQPDKGKEYVTGAMLVNHSIENVWAVVGDAEAAPSYVDDMVTARVVAVQKDTILVEQGMKVNRFEFRYLVRMFPFPGEKILFQLEKGSFRAMDGGWWLYPVQGGKTLLVYSMHLDPGALCPKAPVRNSLMKKIPETLVALNGEIQRRSGYAAVR